MSMHSQKVLYCWGEDKRSGTKSLLRCANLVVNYKKHLTSVMVNKGFATKY